MHNRTQTATDIKQIIIETIKETDPETVKKLINLVQKKVNINEETLFLFIQELEDEKRVFFSKPLFPESIFEYLYSKRVKWYWLLLITGFLATLSVLVISEKIPELYIRAFLGIILLFYLPGFAVLKALYPLTVPLRTPSSTLDSIERVGLNVGLSLAVTPIIGLVLYYTPWSSNNAVLTVSLLFLIISCATLGLIREYRAKKRLFLRKVVGVVCYEFKDNTLRFFNEQGLVLKRLIVIREIPLDAVKKVSYRDSELNITYSDITNIFLMRNSNDCIELFDKLSSML
jgi:hypothetical protein